MMTLLCVGRGPACATKDIPLTDSGLPNVTSPTKENVFSF